MRTFERPDGATLAYRVTAGSGGGDPVVCLHGFAVDSRSWAKALLAALGDAARQVVTVDLRNHGSSSRSPSALAPDTLPRDVLALVADLDLGAWSLFSYSMGAIVGARVARLSPESLLPKRVVLGGMGDRLVQPDWARPRDLARALRGEGDSDDGARYAAFIRRVGGDPAALAAVQDSIVLTAPQDLAAVLGGRVATLVLAGIDDNENGDPAALAAALTGSVLVRSPGNHISAASTQEFVAAAAAFLR